MSKLIASVDQGRMLRYRPKRGSAAAERRYRREKVTKARRKELFERDGHRCVRCGSAQDLTADHIVPMSKGGTKELDNLQTLCGACNYVKADRLI